MGKRAARCVCSAMAALLMATTVFVVPAAADVGGSRDASEDVRVVRVAFPEVEGISETDADGVRSGILYDWLAEVSKYTGWTYEFVDGDVQGLMKRTSAGEIDLMGGMYYREQLVDSFQYSNFAIGANHALLISLEENDDVVVFDSRTLNGKTIGVFENATEKIRRLENYLDFNDIHCIVLPLDYDAYSKCLDDGTADVVLCSPSFYALILKAAGREFLPVTNEAMAATGNVGTYLGMTWVEAGVMAQGSAKYYDKDGTLQTVDFSKVDFVVYHHSALSAVTNFETAVWWTARTLWAPVLRWS